MEPKHPDRIEWEKLDHNKKIAMPLARAKLPHGWLVRAATSITFVPFTDDGIGWSKND